MLVSFVIPAHNEADLIGETVASVLGAARDAGVQHEVVVADDASSDCTGDIASAAGARVVRVEARQIAAARNAGAAHAHGDVLIFVDADTQVNAAVVRAAVRAMAGGAVGGGARVRFDSPTPLWVRALMPAVMRLYQLCRLAAGCCLFCTREAFERAGGFDETLFAGEEVELSRALGRQGRMVMVKESVTTSGRKLRTHSASMLLGLLARFAIGGKRVVRTREGLDLWYGPRIPDPARARRGQREERT